MRIFSVSALVLCLAVSAHAQLSFGPGGVSSSPINLVKVFKLIRNVVSSFMGWDNQPKAKTNGVDVAESRTDDGADYQSDLERLKSRIQEASKSVVEEKKLNNGWTRIKGQSVASMKDHEKFMDDPESKQAFLLPKTSVVVGKWPWVYGAINILLLGGLLVLAQPYFYEGETVVTQYENELVNAHGAIDPYSLYPGHFGGYSGGYESVPSYGSHSVHEGYAPVSEELYSAYHQPSYEEQEHAIESAYAKREVPKDAFRGFGPGPAPNIVRTVPKSSTKKKVAIPASGGSSNIPSRVVARPVLNVEPRVPQEGLGNVLNPHPDKESDPPLNELYYYNPTVFTSAEESTYGCLERMVCLNPSRTARSLAQSSARKIMASSTAGKDQAETSRNLAGVMRRLDLAAERGDSDQEECAKYYCPPAVPAVNPPVGEDYVPPPSQQIPTIATTETPIPVKTTTRKRVTTFGARRGHDQPEVANFRTNGYSQISTQQAGGQATRRALSGSSATRRDVPITRKVVTRIPIADKSEPEVAESVESVDEN